MSERVPPGDKVKDVQPSDFWPDVSQIEPPNRINWIDHPIEFFPPQKTQKND